MRVMLVVCQLAGRRHRVNINLDLSLATSYRSLSQQARVVTEAWATNNLYCIACSSLRIEPTPPNRAAIDFLCPSCEAPYRLKSSVRPFSTRVVDGAYCAMLRAIEQELTPNLLLLRYSVVTSAVSDLEFIPKFALTRSSLEERTPLSATARRAGWVGCNILLSNIPPDARIALIKSGKVTPPRLVRAQYRLTVPLSNLAVARRGWTLDVLNVVRNLGRSRFSLQDVYAHEQQLAALHPVNRNVRPKIRQQLQVLRDLGLVQFLSAGQYLVRPATEV